MSLSSGRSGERALGRHRTLGARTPFAERAKYVSILTNRMVELGWLARKPGQNRRTYRLTLTPAARQLLDKVISRTVELADHTLPGISSAQLRTNLELIGTRLRGYTPLEK